MNYTDGSGQMIPVRGIPTHLIIKEQKPFGTLQLPTQQIRLVGGDIGNLPPPLLSLVFTVTYPTDQVGRRAHWKFSPPPLLLLVFTISEFFTELYL